MAMQETGTAVVDEATNIFLLELAERSAINTSELKRLQAMAKVGADVEALVRSAGVADDVILAAAQAAFGIPPTPRSCLRVEDAEAQRAVLGVSGVPLDRALWQRLQAAPALLGDVLVVAYARGSFAVAGARAAELPPHRPTLASPQAILAYRLALLGEPAPSTERMPAPPTLLTLPLLAPPSAEAERTMAVLTTIPAMPPLEPVGRAEAAVLQSLAQEETAQSDQQRIGRWRLEQHLGSGASADVYLATSDGGQRAALKVLRLDGGVADEQRLRFAREVDLVERLTHVNVVRLYDRGTVDGRPWMACEFVDGGSVADLLTAAGPLPVVLAVRIICNVLRGLEAAHALGVVHRDLKPGNLLLSRSGACKVADFGVAKIDDNLSLTQEGVAYGTPAYMSPEQASGQPLDHKSDLFSVGIVLWHMLTGENPFVRATVPATLVEVTKADPGDLLEHAPGVPLLLDRVVTTLLARDPAQRFASATHALEALQPLLDWIEVNEPGVLLRALAAPAQTAQRLRQTHAELEERRARAALARRPSMRQEAALARRRAQALHHDDTVAATLAELCAQQRYHLDAARIDSLPDVVKAVTRREMSAPLLRRAGIAHFDAGNLVEAQWFLRRAHAMGANDDAVASRVRALLGQAPLAPFELPRRAAGEEVRQDAALSQHTVRVVRADDMRAAASVSMVPQRLRAALPTVVVGVGCAAIVAVLAFAVGRASTPTMTPAVVQVDEDDVGARQLVREATTAAKQGDRATALLFAERVITNTPRSASAVRAAALAGGLYAEAGDTARARRSFERVLENAAATFDQQQEARAMLASLSP